MYIVRLKYYKYYRYGLQIRILVVRRVVEVGFWSRVGSSWLLSYSSRLSLRESKPDFNARVARASSIPKFPTTTKQRTVAANTHRQRQNAGGVYYETTLKATKLLYRQENEHSVNVCVGLPRTSYVTCDTVILSRYYSFYVQSGDSYMKVKLMFMNFMFGSLSVHEDKLHKLQACIRAKIQTF